jgi:preprotein translocase subunit SecG
MASGRSFHLARVLLWVSIALVGVSLALRIIQSHVTNIARYNMMDTVRIILSGAVIVCMIIYFYVNGRAREEARKLRSKDLLK